MSEALKVMAQAMAAEIARQTDDMVTLRANGLLGSCVGGDDFEIDLERVARAGLTVLKEIPIDAPAAENIEVYGAPIGGAADTVFCLTIDAILRAEQ